MNLIFLSPHVGPNYHHVCQALHNLGATVLAIGSAPFDQLESHLTGSLEEYYKVENMFNYDELLRAVGYFTHRYGRIDAIENASPCLLVTEARLRTDFHIDGINQTAVAAYLNYSSMKKICRRARVSPAYSDPITSLETAKEYINEVNYPVLAKPDRILSNQSRYIITNETELHSFWDNKPEELYILRPDTLVSGLSFDGLVNKSGEIVFYASHISSTTSSGESFIYSERDIPPDLEKAGRKLIQAGSLSNRFFHIALSRNSKNKLLVENISLFPANSAMIDMFNFANDIDMYQEWAGVLVQNPFTAEYSRPYHCAYIDTVHNQFDEHYRPLIVAQTPSAEIVLQPPAKPAYIARSACLDELLELRGALQTP